MAGKSARKSARSKGRPFTGKDDPRNGRGPAPGAPNAGRPPDKFKQEMQRMASRDETLERLDQLTGKRRKGTAGVTDDLFLRAFKEVADRGYGKPAQPVEHTGPDGGAIQFEDARTARESLARELTGVKARGRAD